MLDATHDDPQEDGDDDDDDDEEEDEESLVKVLLLAGLVMGSDRRVLCNRFNDGDVAAAAAAAALAALAARDFDDATCFIDVVVVE